jgi:protein-disulfide isomerase
MMHTARFARAGAGFALALTLLAAATACGQTPARGGQRAATAATATPAELDSLVPRAQRARVKGVESARVTIVEISDFQCPFCREWAEETYPRIDSAYIRTGKARLIFIAFPLPNHTQAYAATEAAFCAGAQGKFWEMHDALFAAQRSWNGQADAVARFDETAERLRLDMEKYRDCTQNDRPAPLIVNDIMQAATAGIQGTPTFILNGQTVLDGAVSFAEMSRAIDAILAQPAAPAGAPPGQPQQPPRP